jgi:hypothetical protein
MRGRRSLNVELIPLDPNLERNLGRAHRAHVEMGDNERIPGCKGEERGANPNL